MAHVLFITDMPSFTDGFVIKGPMELEDDAMDKRKYPIQGIRKGYNRPMVSRMVWNNARVKKEAADQYVDDMITIVNFNPIDNKTTLKDVLFPEKNCETASVGSAIKAIRWIFKWLNRRKTLSSLIGFFALVDFWLSHSPLHLVELALFILFVLFQPLKPVGHSNPTTSRNFTTFWSYHYIFGKLDDTDNGHGEEL